MKRLFVFLLVSIYMCLSACAVNDFFGFSQHAFSGEQYFLKWSTTMTDSVYIEDFLPHNASFTRFPTKLSFSLLKNHSFERVVGEKMVEIDNGRMAGSVMDMKNLVISDNEVISSYVSELSQGGVTMVVQFSVFRFVRRGNDVIIFEWVRREYKDAEKFKKLVSEKRDEWVRQVVDTDLSIVSLVK